MDHYLLTSLYHQTLFTTCSSDGRNQDTYTNSSTLLQFCLVCTQLESDQQHISTIHYLPQNQLAPMVKPEPHAAGMDMNSTQTQVAIKPKHLHNSQLPWAVHQQEKMDLNYLIQIYQKTFFLALCQMQIYANHSRSCLGESWVVIY